MVGAIVDGLRSKAVSSPPASPTTYYPIHAYGWRDADDRLSWVRYSFVPRSAATPVQTFGGPDRLFEEMAAG